LCLNFAVLLTAAAGLNSIQGMTKGLNLWRVEYIRNGRYYFRSAKRFLREKAV